MKKLALLLIVAVFFTGCDILDQIANQVNQGGAVSVAPSSTEIVQGLKKALNMGADYAVTNLHKRDGYYGNAKVKIPLPQDVNNVINVAMQNNTVKRLGLDKVLQKKVDNFVLAINRSAEEAAIQAKPIFVSAITGLSISQGIDILRGSDIVGHRSGFDSLAATHYLDYKTRPQLFRLFKPKLDNTLNKDLGLGFSANQAWDQVLKYYNGYVAPILGKQKINYTLSDYATNKALDGAFYMMGQQEKKIRKNPYKFAVDIIKKVFGYVYKA